MSHTVSRNHLLVVAVALILFSFDLSQRRAEGAASTAPATAPAPESATVKRGDLNLAFSTNAWFEPIDAFELRIRPKSYQGDLTVTSAATHGAQVAKGDVILELDSTQLNRQIAAAENELQLAQANLQKATIDVEQGTAADELAMKMQLNDVKNSEEGLKWWDQVDGKHMLKNADIAVQNTKDTMGDQEDELDQLKKMYKSEELTNATADIVVKRAVRAHERTKVALGMAEERAAKIKENDHGNARERLVFTVDQQKQALERLEAQQAQSQVHRNGALVSAKLALESAQEKLANLQADAPQFVAKAPEKMTILYGQLTNGAWQNNNPRSLRAGEKIAAQQVVMTGYSPTRLRVVAEIPEGKVMLVTSGMSAIVSPTSMPGVELKGTCQSPSMTTAPGAQNFTAAIELTQVDQQIAPGMKASVRIDAGKIDKCLLVPNSSIKDRKVWIRRSDGSEKAAEVVAGRSDGELTEIKHGLSENDIVLKEAKK